MKTRTLHRTISMLLTAAMVLNMGISPAFAEGAVPGTSGLTKCHMEHDKDCGYTETVTMGGCTHEHDGDCGYTQGTAEQPCTFVPDEDMEASPSDSVRVSDALHIHDETCGYAPATDGMPCDHKHDDTCGYGETITVTNPCIHTCKVCKPVDGGKPAEKLCTCPPVDSGELVHGEDCPLYVALELREAVDAPNFSGGTGAQDDPWQIKTEVDLVALSTFVNDGSAADFDTGTQNIGNFFGYYFQQTADIDMTNVAWEPIGYSGTYYFAGNYDGGDFTVRNLRSSGKVGTEGDDVGYATAGLFGWAAFGSVANVKVDKAVLTATGEGNYSYVGGIAAVVFGSAIENCTVTDSIIASRREPNNSNCAGGIAGYSTGGRFEDCTSKGNTITTMCYGGGFVGEIDDDYGVGASSFTSCTVEECTITSNSDDVQITTQIGGFAGTVTTGYLTITNCDVLFCQTISDNDPQSIHCSMGIFVGDVLSGERIQDTDCRYATNEANPKNIGSSAVRVIKVGDQYVAVADVKTADELNTALANDLIGYIYITGSFSYNESISKKVTINVKNGSMLTLKYSTATDISTVCNANITVENGGTICFASQSATQDYLVMNGSFVLSEGAKATTTALHARGNILFQGSFTNDGSFDVYWGTAYLKYGTTPGTFTMQTETGTPSYNLCLTMPTKTSSSDAKLYITGVVGTVAVGETLHPVLDGFGEIKEAIPGLAISWGDSSNGGATYEYTVPASKAGSALTVKVNGSPQSPVSYFLVDGAVVTKVTTPGDGYTTEKVALLDTVYIGGVNKSDSNTGASADKAVATLAAAYTLVADGGTIVVCGTTTAGNENDYIVADKSITISNADGTTTYADAQLDWPCVMFFKTVTIKNVKLTNTASQSKQFNLYPLAATAVANLENISSEGAVLVYNQVGTNSLNNSTFNIKNTSDLMFVTAGYISTSYPVLNLDHSTVISDNSTDVLGDVSLKNGSTLLTTQTISNLTSDNSENAIALFSDDDEPVPVTVNGIVTIADDKPITLLNYTGSSYEAFAAGDLTLLISSTENESLTPDKFVTKDTVNYGLKKVGNHIVTVKKIILISIDTAISVAKDAKNDIVVDDRAASSVPHGTRFVTTAEIAALDSAIKTAEDAKITAASTEEAEAAAGALNHAVAVFKTAIKTGTYKKDENSSSGGSSSGSSITYYVSLPENYRGGTKIIGNVQVPDYTVEGNWIMNTAGTWQLYNKNGVAYTSGWVAVFNPNAQVAQGQSAFDWFLFDAAGNMMTGWYTDDLGNTYYLNPERDKTQGAMAIGWRLIDGHYYYFDKVSEGFRGKLLKETTTPDGYRVDQNGIWDVKIPKK